MEFIKTVVILLSQIKNAIMIKLTSCEETKIQPDTPLRDWRASRNAHQNVPASGFSRRNNTELATKQSVQKLATKTILVISDRVS